MFKKLNSKLKDNINKPLLITAFTCFVLIALWIAIFKCNIYRQFSTSLEETIYFSFKERFMMQFSKTVEESNGLILLLLNIVLFMPLGIYLPLLNKKLNFIKTLLIGLGCSFLIETIQLFLGIGSFEYIDLICNTIGCILGYQIYKSLRPFTTDLVINYINLVISIVAIPVVVFAFINTIINFNLYMPFFDGTSFKYLFK